MFNAATDPPPRLGGGSVCEEAEVKAGAGQPAYTTDMIQMCFTTVGGRNIHKQSVQNLGRGGLPSGSLIEREKGFSMPDKNTSSDKH